MPTTREQNAAMRPVLNIFYVLDTSGSMRGESITRLNRAMEETIDAVRMEAMHNSNAHVKVAVLEFNSTCRWVNPTGPEDLEHFFWEDLTAGGNTYVGDALKELDSKLSSKGFLNSMSGCFLPVIIFMTDGYANDTYEPALDAIRHNKWFNRATRVGFAIGKNPDMEMIAKLAGSSENVIRTEDLGEFAQLIRWVSVTASLLQSQSRTSGSRNVARDAVKQAKRNAGYEATAFTPDFQYEEEPIPDSYWGVGSVFVDSSDYDSVDSF